MLPHDEAILRFADYVCDASIESDEAYQTARICLADTIGCAIKALQYPACTKLLGPVVPGTVVPNGSRVLGTNYVLDPILAAFNIGLMLRWLDYNDTWLAAEWGHPSDNLGGLLAITDYLSRVRRSQGKYPLTINTLLTAMIKAHEIQGQLALENSFNRVGLDHVILVKVATAAVVTHLLGGSKQQIADAISQAWIDIGPLRTYRHAPNTGSRKSWAAGDATSRGVFLAMMTMRGEMGYPKALTAKQWGLYDVLFKGKHFTFQRPLGSYVMENVLFKVAFPAEFHAQTAVEAAINAHNLIKSRYGAIHPENIQSISIETHESALRIIDKKGPLRNPADRDHCLQYMTAVALIKGQLTADDYEDGAAEDVSINLLREKMELIENRSFTEDYLNPEKRSIANALTIVFKDGYKTDRLVVEYPLGHRRRRQEALPLIFQKLESNLLTHYDQTKVNDLMALFQDPTKLCQMDVYELITLLCHDT